MTCIEETGAGSWTTGATTQFDGLYTTGIHQLQKQLQHNVIIWHHILMTSTTQWRSLRKISFTKGFSHCKSLRHAIVFLASNCHGGYPIVNPRLNLSGVVALEVDQTRHWRHSMEQKVNPPSHYAVDALDLINRRLPLELAYFPS
jgi:hypothetical protein